MIQRRFENKVVVALGSATGLGAETVRRLAAEGATLVVGDVNESAMTKLAAEIQSAGGIIETLFADLHDEASLSALMSAAAHRHGRIDCLHNNGADLALIAQDLDVMTINPQVFQRTLHGNLLGFLLSARFAIPHMIERGGSIVQTSSLAGQFGGGESIRLAYACAKAGIDVLTRHIAARWGKRGIRCNSVAPGLMLTETVKGSHLPLDDILADTPYSRLGVPQDTAAAVAFLLSDDSAFINGQVIRVDGGISAVMTTIAPKFDRNGERVPAAM